MAKRDRSEGGAFNAKMAWILCAVLFAGCGGGGGGGNNSGGGGPSGIGPSGGTASSGDGRGSVTVPAGALSQDTAIAVAVASNPPAGNIGTAYDFGPDGTNFSQPVTISITYDDANLPGGVTESNLTLGTVANNQWTAVANATVDTVTNVVSGTTTHFSVYGVIAVGDSGTVPAAPTGVTVAAGDGQVTVSWDAVPGATSYNVYMAAQSGVTKSNYSAFMGGKAHPGVPNPFVHTGLTNGTTYYFVVTAVNSIGESDASTEESATPIAAPIPNPPHTVSFEFDATVVSAPTNTALVGQTGKGHVTYDTSQRILLGGGSYGFESPPAEFTFDLGEISLVAGSKPNTAAQDLTIDLRNDRVVIVNQPQMDAVFYWGDNISQKIDGFNIRMVLALHDSTGTVLDDVSVPSAPPSLSDFDTYNFQIQYEPTPGTWTLEMSLRVNSITPTP